MLRKLLGVALLVCMLMGKNVALAQDAPNNGIPVVSITIEGGDEEFNKMNTSEDHSYACGGTMSVTVPDGYADSCGLTSPASFNNLTLDYIRGRGNSTWDSGGGRNPYKIKLKNKKALLGAEVGASKHWVLLASPIDTSSLRNRVVAYMAFQLGFEFVPVGVHVDLVINGTYRGSYYLAEQVRVEEPRVNIDELTITDIAEPEVTGGYLFCMTPKTSEPERNRLQTSRGIEFCGSYPEFDPTVPGSNEQKAYLAQYLQETEDAVWSLGDWGEYMDAESAARYWWVQEFTKNQDAFVTPSTYLYKKRDGKIYWGPLWDFDQCMGVPSGDVEGFTNREMDWLDFLRSYDASFQEELRESWVAYDAALDELLRMGGILDQLANELQPSWQADFELRVKDTPAGRYAKSFDEEVEALRSWISERRAWISSHVDDELTNVFGLVTFMDGNEKLSSTYVRIDSYLYVLPDPPRKDGKVFVGWANKAGKIVDGDVEVKKDIVLQARYAVADDPNMAEDLYLGTYDVWGSVGDTFRIGYTVVPEGTQEQYPQWVSSDPAVAEVNAYGVVSARQAGDATITGTLANGLQKTLAVHVVQTSGELSTTVEAITLDGDTLVLTPGAYGQMRPTIVPQANDMVMPSYEVEDEGVATIDSNGVVHAVAPGTTTVRLLDAYDSEKAYASYVVVVKDDGSQEPTPEHETDSGEETQPEDDPTATEPTHQDSSEAGSNPQNKPSAAAVERPKQTADTSEAQQKAATPSVAPSAPLQRTAVPNPRTADSSFSQVCVLVALGTAMLLLGHVAARWIRRG